MPSSSKSKFNVLNWKQRCYDAMSDDFNTPVLIAELFGAVKYINQIKDGNNTIGVEELEILKKTLNNFIFDILGLENEKDKSSKSKLADTVKILINIRNQARKEKNFKLSDQIRNQLIDIGIQLKDSKDGTNFFVD